MLPAVNFKEVFQVLAIDDSEMTFMGLKSVNIGFTKKVDITRKTVEAYTLIETMLNSGFKYNAVLINIKLDYKGKKGPYFLEEIRKLE